MIGSLPYDKKSQIIFKTFSDNSTKILNNRVYWFSNSLKTLRSHVDPLIHRKFMFSDLCCHPDLR